MDTRNAAPGDAGVARRFIELEPDGQLLTQARRRGDLPRQADLELMLDVLIGTVYSRLREFPGPLDEKWVRSVVRLVLAGVGTGRNTG